MKGDSRAYFLYCKTDFYAKLSEIKENMSTQKHMERSKPYNSAKQSTLPFLYKKTDSSNQAEAIMAMAIAEHCSILACDNIGETCKDAGQ